MKILMIACTDAAYRLMQKLKNKWIEELPDTLIIDKVKCSALPEYSMPQSVSECVAEYFTQVDAVVFLSATGIAVRSIAPCIRHKSSDPAVIVIDEAGRFCISLLSGHTGGANALTEYVAKLIGAVPVITTATDREGRFAVDDYARKNGMTVTDWELAKKISADILNGGLVGLCVDNDCAFSGQQRRQWKAALRGVVEADDCGPAITRGVQISYLQSIKPVFQETLQLIPRLFVVGIGCRRGTPEKEIASAVRECLLAENIHDSAVCALASVDLKAQEEGILSYCRKAGLPFLTYSVEELKVVKGDYTESSFVEQVTGVSNVCERSAVLAAGGELICKKKVYNGVAVAIARKG